MTGILLIQLGTPDAPTKEALYPYLKDFLSDPRVIEDQGLKWRLILNGIILRKRPEESAKKYARIWDPQTGSPLLHYTRRQTELLQQSLPNIPVRFGMQIGNPSLEKTVEEMIAQGIDRIIVMPMYPQYSATTFASATDALFKVLMKQRKVPAIRIVPPYYAHPAYIESMASVIKDSLAKLPWKPDHYLISFHGIPKSYSDKGDPYATHVEETTRLLQESMQFPEGMWSQTFQSLFGRAEWLRPYTDDTLQELAKQGVKKVFVMLPGFTADCLETIDEIGNESKHIFVEAGGENLVACPCLNDHPSWIEAMKTIVLEEGKGWLN
jgi:ferrochelatase